MEGEPLMDRLRIMPGENVMIRILPIKESHQIVPMDSSIICRPRKSIFSLGPDKTCPLCEAGVPRFRWVLVYDEKKVVGFKKEWDHGKPR